MTKSTEPKNIVLYADDDMDDLELVSDAFHRYAKNVEIITVKDGSQALAYLKNLGEDDPAPCLIILDINMHMISGKDVLSRIRQMDRFESIPVVLFTTSSLPQDAAFAKRYDAGFVTKPLDYGQMEYITGQFIDHCTEEIQRNIRRRS